MTGSSNCMGGAEGKCASMFLSLNLSPADLRVASASRDFFGPWPPLDRFSWRAAASAAPPPDDLRLKVRPDLEQWASAEEKHHFEALPESTVISRAENRALSVVKAEIRGVQDGTS